MSTRTRNYNLIKPDGDDLVNVEDLNENFDEIDSQMRANADGLTRKQNALTFDDEPTAGSNNPVKSGGVYSALQEKQDKLTFDNAPVAGSNNPVKSSGVYSALAGKQDKLTFDATPTAGSNNPVKSGGVFSALAGKQSDLTQVPTVSSLLDTDYLFLERGGAIYKIRASAVIIPSGDTADGMETESGDTILTEDGQEILIDTGGDDSDAVTTESGEQLLTEEDQIITID